MSPGDEGPSHRPLIGVTVGDPAGIGPEIVIKALCDARTHRCVRPLVFADRVILEQTRALLEANVRLHPVDSPAQGEYSPGVLDFIDAGALAEPAEYGRVCASAGHAAGAYLEQAIRAALDGQIAGLVTGPLNKESLRAAHLPFIDHTQLLASRAARHVPMTMFLVRTLRIFFLTRHISLADVPAAITRRKLMQALPLCELYLRQLGLEEPCMAVAALNPHGGEGGLFGREEADVIEPAVQYLQRRGLRVRGPVPADAVFHQCLQGRYQGVLALYHDQGHIAAKTLDFHATVSLTLGLEFLRTSVDHGTAFDIAGQGRADPRAMVAAIQAAARYAEVVRARTGWQPRAV